MDFLKNGKPVAAYEKVNTPVLTETPEGILVSKRKEYYDSVGFNVTKVIDGHGSFCGNIRLRLAQKGASKRIGLYFKVTQEFNGLRNTSWARGSVETVGQDWVVISGGCMILQGADVEEVILYFIQEKDPTGELPDILVCDSDFERCDPDTMLKDVPPLSSIDRPQKMAFGVIRWDAYFSTNTSEMSVSNQVARALSPKEYHSFAPWFSRVTEDGQIAFDGYTQELFDQETRLAAEAGVNYWAYCWYQSDSPMSGPRKLHKTSPYKNQVKMTALLGVYNCDDITLQELYYDLQQDYYFRLNGRPVVFMYDAFRAEDDYTQKIQHGAEAAGLKELIYFAAMGVPATPMLVSSLRSRGYEAISEYSCSADEKEEPYKNLTMRVEGANEIKGMFHKVVGVIPQISCGRDTRPRLDHPTTWAGGYGGKYVVTGTEEELYEHASRVLSMLRQHPEKTMPNMVITYAWNEHDEGGWCCPTLTCGIDGIPEKNPDGTNKMNASHLNALTRAIREYRETEK